MRQAITIGYRHDKDVGEVISGPAEKPGAHKDALKELGKSPTHPEFSRIEVWESDMGITMFRKFEAPEKPVPVNKRFAVTK